MGRRRNGESLGIVDRFSTKKHDEQHFTEEDAESREL